MELEHLYEDRYHHEEQPSLNSQSEPTLQVHRPESWSFLYVDTEDGLDQPVVHTDEGMRTSATVERIFHNTATAIYNTAADVDNHATTHHTATTTDKATVVQSTIIPSEAKIGPSQITRCLSTLQIYFGGIKNVHVTKYKPSSQIITTITNTITTDPVIPPSETQGNNSSNINTKSHSHSDPNSDPSLAVNTTHHMYDVVLHRVTCSDIQELNTLLPRLWTLMKPNNSLHVMVLSRSVDSHVNDHRGVNKEALSHTISTNGTSTCFDAVVGNTISTNTSTPTISTEMISLPPYSTMKCCPLNGVIGAKCVYFRYGTHSINTQIFYAHKTY